MHGLSNGQAHIVALLSVAAGIPLAAAMEFSRSKSIAIVFGNKKRAGGFDLSPNSPQGDIFLDMVF